MNQGHRISQILLAGLAIAASTPFQLLTGFLLIAVYVVIRALLLAGVVLLPLSVFEDSRHMAAAPTKTFGHCLLSAGAFTLGASVHSLAVRTVMSSEVPLSLVMRILLTIIITVVAFAALWPLLKVWKPMKGRGPVNNIKNAMDSGKKAGKTGAAIAAAGATGGATAAAAAAAAPLAADKPAEVHRDLPPLPPITTTRPMHALPTRHTATVAAPASPDSVRLGSDESGFAYPAGEPVAAPQRGDDAFTIYSSNGGSWDDEVFTAERRRREGRTPDGAVPRPAADSDTDTTPGTSNTPQDSTGDPVRVINDAGHDVPVPSEVFRNLIVIDHESDL